LSGGADNAARLFDVTTGQSQQVAQHEAPVKVVKWIDAQGGILATGSWDKTIKASYDVLASLSISQTVHFVLVLGFAHTQSSIDCPTSRTLLQHGRTVSADGSRNR
jgi:WD40 repeat protein